MIRIILILSIVDATLLAVSLVVTITGNIYHVFANREMYAAEKEKRALLTARREAIDAIKSPEWEPVSNNDE